MIKDHGLNVLVDELLIEHVDHLQKGHVIGNLRNRVSLDAAFGLRARLAPNVDGEIHYL